VKYTVTWEKKLVVVDYFGDIENKDIKGAHFELNGDDRFYDCDFCILNISECNLGKVSVPDLMTVVATDFGASKTNQELKVAMITTDPSSLEKASEYIDTFCSLNSTWEFKILPSINNAQKWFGA
jgi:hypothetical protein